jgi:MFS family permease
MKQGPTMFLRLVVILIGLIVLGLCVFALPAGIMSDNTGYYRPILLGLYVPAVPFFIALYQTLRLLSHIDTGNAFSQLSVNTLKNIKHCAVIISGLFCLGMPYIFQAADKDDAPGVALLGFIIIGASAVIAVFAAVLQKLLQSAMDIKSENDLTV